MASSGSSSAHEDHVSRQKKRKISNRESAKRSRMRKQQHLNELMGQVSQLNKENACVVTDLNLTRQMCLNVEAENSVLRAQFSELTHRLMSLKDIIGWSLNKVENNCNTNHHVMVELDGQMMMMMNGGDYLNPWNNCFT